MDPVRNEASPLAMAGMLVPSAILTETLTLIFCEKEEPDGRRWDDALLSNMGDGKELTMGEVG